MSRYGRGRGGGFGRYVPVAERRAKAEALVGALRKKGRTITPVRVEGRTIAKTFWGQAWCENLEGYSDYANRLPRGRTYARNGSVVDLQVEAGVVEALVMGSSLYKVRINIARLSETRWAAIRSGCGGQINALVELLTGRLSSGVMEVVTRRGEGLFPSPKEIELSCSCPDWATMCKHVAAALYGVGVRLDHEPGLLFTLRGVDPEDLVEAAFQRGARRGSSARKTLAAGELSRIFGVNIDFSDDALDAAEGGAAREHQELSGRARAVLDLVTDHPGIQSVDLSTQLNISRAIVRGALVLLKRRGLVIFTGARRTGGYFPT